MKKVLVIDPEDNSSIGICSLLRRDGYEFDYIKTGQDYSTRICTTRYDGVILGDLRIPGDKESERKKWKCGLEILEDLKERGLPCVVVSAELAAINNQAQTLGARILTKPEDPEVTIAALKEILGYEKG